MGGIVQYSGVAINNFANSIVYTVTAEDNSTQNYIVTCARQYMEDVPENTTGFVMGSTLVGGDAIPEHTVASISTFTMGRYEVTYKLWYNVRLWAESNGYTFANKGIEGNNGTEDAASETNEPVTTISWSDCIAWCNALSEKEGLTPCYYTDSTRNTVYRDATDYTSEISKTNPINSNNCVDWEADGYRLPTEAEWEYAARYIDGINFTQGNRPSGATEDNKEDIYTWYVSNSDLNTHDVGTKEPNFLGIYDISGNVKEWCLDWYANYTTETPFTDADTKGPLTGTNKIDRGGGYAAGISGFLQVSFRVNRSITYTFQAVSFRVVRTP